MNKRLVITGASATLGAAIGNWAIYPMWLSRQPLQQAAGSTTARVVTTLTSAAALGTIAYFVMGSRLMAKSRLAASRRALAMNDDQTAPRRKSTNTTVVGATRTIRSSSRRYRLTPVWASRLDADAGKAVTYTVNDILDMLTDAVGDEATIRVRRETPNEKSRGMQGADVVVLIRSKSEDLDIIWPGPNDEEFTGQRQEKMAMAV